MNRTCRICDTPLARKPEERQSKYERRQTCGNPACKTEAAREAQRRPPHPTSDRLCAYCGSVIPRRPHESESKYARRVTCGAATCLEARRNPHAKAKAERPEPAQNDILSALALAASTPALVVDITELPPDSKRCLQALCRERLAVRCDEQGFLWRATLAGVLKARAITTNRVASTAHDAPESPRGGLAVSGGAGRPPVQRERHTR